MSRDLLRIQGEADASQKSANEARSDAAKAYREAGSVQAKLNVLQQELDRRSSLVEINSKQEIIELHEQVKTLRAALKAAELDEATVKQSADAAAAREEADRAYEEAGEIRAKYDELMKTVNEQQDEITKLTLMLESEDRDKVPKFKATIKALSEDLELTKAEKKKLELEYENKLSAATMDRNNEEISKLNGEINMLRQEIDNFKDECKQSNNDAIALLGKTQSMKDEIEVKKLC
jgi:chromosome segregation ATPase